MEKNQLKSPAELNPTKISNSNDSYQGVDSLPQTNQPTVYFQK